MSDDQLSSCLYKRLVMMPVRMLFARMSVFVGVDGGRSHALRVHMVVLLLPMNS